MRKKYYKVVLDPREIKFIQLFITLSGGTPEDSVEFGEYLSNCLFEDGLMKIEHQYMAPLWHIFSEANRTALENPSYFSKAVQSIFQRIDKGFH